MKSQEAVLVEWVHGRLTLGEASHALRELRGKENEDVVEELQKMGNPQDLELAKLISNRRFQPKYAVMDDPQARYAEERAEKKREEERAEGQFRTPSERPYDYHFLFLRNGFELHLSRAYSLEEERDREVVQMWASSNCQTRLDLWPVRRRGPDSEAEIGPRYSDELLEELFEECRDLYGTKNRRGGQ